MKLSPLFLTFVFLLGGLFSVAKGQDTVRYGDPWYQFNPLPRLLRYEHYSPLDGDGPCSYLSGTHRRFYLGYKNNENVIYGIAVVIDSVPGPEWYYMAALLRGIEYHDILNANSNRITNEIILDSIYQEDTIKAWENPLIKKCRFEYFYEYDSIHHTYKSDSAFNCYEFYFDTPIMGNLKDVLADTFFVGVGHCVPIQEWGHPYLYEVISGVGEEFSTPYLHIAAEHVTYNRPVNPYIINHWGGIFPIIERRCSVPRGLTLADDSLSVHWRSDTDAEFFQLSVCADTVEPDFGRLFTTSSTALALPTLHPDSTYHIYLRKQCAFRQDSVWSDWSAPLVIASRTTEGIGEAENNGWTIDINPNPATKQVHVATNFSLTQIEAFDEQGRLVQTLPATGLKADLDVSSWPRGTYLLRILTPAGPTTKKLLVQ